MAKKFSPYESRLDFFSCYFSGNSSFFDHAKNLSENSDTVFLTEDFRIILSYRTEKRSIFWVTDKMGNKLISVCSSKSARPYFEMVGVFFLAYYDFFDYFLDFFGIDKEKKQTESDVFFRRVDHCFDFFSLSQRDFIFSPDFPMDSASFFGSIDKGTGNLLTIGGPRSSDITHRVGLYDKRADTIRANKFKVFDNYGNNIYQPYFDSLYSIWRLEIRFYPRSCRRWLDRSVNDLVRDSAQLAYDYAKKYYVLTNFDFQVDRHFIKNLPRPDTKNNDKILKKSAFYENMARSYLSTLRELNGEKWLFSWINSEFSTQNILGTISVFDGTDKIGRSKTGKNRKIDFYRSRLTDSMTFDEYTDFVNFQNDEKFGQRKKSDILKKL